jgi:hypothetical protein
MCISVSEFDADLERGETISGFEMFADFARVPLLAS